MRYGWKKDPLDARDHFAIHPPSGLKYPVAGNCLEFEAPIGDQGQLGSCTAWGSLGAVASTEKEAHGMAPDLAELAQYFWTREIEGTTGQDSGASIRDAFKALANKGYCPEALCPYVTKNFAKRPSPSAEAAAALKRIHSYQKIQQTQDAIKDSIIRKNPIVIGFTVYSSFETAVVSDLGKMPMPRKGESILGGHCVVIVGYDSDGVICRNSWGQKWGYQPVGAKSRGYFKMPWAFVTDSRYASDFWTMTAVA